jgi:hypothetical protein
VLQEIYGVSRNYWFPKQVATYIGNLLIKFTRNYNFVASWKNCQNFRFRGRFVDSQGFPDLWCNAYKWFDCFIFSSCLTEQAARALEHLKIASLEKKYNNHYIWQEYFPYTAEVRSDLHWWVVNATNENGVFFTAAMLEFQFKRILIRLFCLEHELLPAWGMSANAL